jgi:ABC-type antimicrobial peptide transport system permease subunit
MLSLAACLALLLGLVGIYGVIAYSVTQRRREIGVRLAIGAQPKQVLSLFVRSGLMLASVGILAGVVASSALMRLMSSLLFGVAAVDIPSYVAASLILLVAALLASYLPSRRALRVDPAEALRAE